MKPNKTSFKKGNIMSIEIKEKISKSMKGKNTWMSDKKMSDEIRKKISESNKGKILSKEHINKLSGENHWNWKGGKSSQTFSKLKWRIWRNAVFDRDNYTCQHLNCEFCNNKRGQLLHPHHIKEKKKYPELVFDINNGITYCANYHLKSGLHRRKNASKKLD